MFGIELVRRRLVAAGADQGEFGLGHARLDRGDAHAGAGEVAAQVERELADERLGRGIDRAAAIGIGRGDRRQVDDRALALDQPGSSARVSATRPVTLVSMTLSSARQSAVLQRRPSAARRPALLSSRSMSPHGGDSRASWSTAPRVAHVELERQEGVAQARPPARAAGRRGGRCRSPASRRRAKRRAAAAPIPAVAPVMKMVLVMPLSVELVEDPVARGRPVVDPRMGMLGAGGTARREPRLGDHVQPPDLGRMLGDRGVMDRQIVDEHRARGRVPLDDRARRHALAALVADHFVARCRAPASCSTRQACASSPRLVRMTMSATSPIRPSASSAPGTSVWRCISPRKKRSSSGQTRSSATRLAGRRSVSASANSPRFEVEVDVVRLVQPVGEMGDHVQQHLVAIGDQQRAGSSISSSPGAPRPARRARRRVSATATRSGSWPRGSAMQRGEQRAARRRAVANPSGVDSGQGEEPLGAPFVGQRRSKRAQRQRLGVIWRRRRHRLVLRQRWRGRWFGQDPGCRGQCAQHQAVLRPARGARPRAARR